MIARASIGRQEPIDRLAIDGLTVSHSSATFQRAAVLFNRSHWPSEDDMNPYVLALQNYAVFRGRTSRPGFWFALLLIYVLALIAYFVD